MTLARMFPASAQTDGVHVMVRADYSTEESDPAEGRFVWRYHVRIENCTDRMVQLLDRHWIIIDGRDQRRVVDGEGVVGEQPRIEPGGAFDYVSACPLATPFGQMSGHYGMTDAAGVRFEVAIPTFDLLPPDARQRAN